MSNAKPTVAERAKAIADDVNVAARIEGVAKDVNWLILNHIDQDVEGTEESFQSLRKNLRGLVAEVVEAVLEDLEGKVRRAR